jgi:hypothetical protein
VPRGKAAAGGGGGGETLWPLTGVRDGCGETFAVRQRAARKGGRGGHVGVHVGCGVAGE